MEGTGVSVVAVVLLAVAMVGLAYGVITYNGLVVLKHGVSKAWANIDVLLKQRHDELPKLVEVCKQYMKHEQETLERVMQARALVADARAHEDAAELGPAEGALRSGLIRLYAAAEAYPNLKANDNFQFLQQRITGLENAIADRRELYNDSVNINNVRLEQFPDLLIARLFGFSPRHLLEFSEEERRDVNVAALFR
jgi:LemA protein